MKGNLRQVTMAFGLLFALGVGVFLDGISGPQPQRTWLAYLINFLFWSGIAFGAVVFVAVLNMTSARWARPIKRIAEAPGAFIPVAFLLFWVLYLGRTEIFPWIREPVHGKEGWLAVGFLFARDGAGLFALAGASLLLLYFSVRGDRLAMETGGLGGKACEMGRHWRAQVMLSPLVAILYALVLSLIAWDLVMSLDPHWVSTLFGAYFFIGCFYSALAALIVLAACCARPMGLEGLVQPRHFHDLGKLLLGFCLVTGDFFYSQFLVIWYGNLPEEARYVLLRVRQEPWEVLAWIVLAVCFALPFVVLLSRKIKISPRPMMVLAGMVLVGMWLERFLLVVPSIWKGEAIPLGLPEIGVTAGFLGAMGLCVVGFLRWAPALPVSDPLFREAGKGVPRVGSV